MKSSHVILLLGILLFWSCTGSETVDSAATSEVSNAAATDNNSASAKFVANPIKGEKVEVKTLEIGADAPDFNLPEADGVLSP